MTRASFSVLFYIKRAKLHRDGKSPIYARITINGERAEFVLQASIEESLWDNKHGKAKGMTKTAKELNSFLGTVRINIVVKKRELEENGEKVTAMQLRSAYNGLDIESKTILGIFKEHNVMVEGLINKDFAPGTVERYKTCYKHVEDFIKLNYNRSDMNLPEINQMFISKFDYYLKTERKCCHNSATKYLKNFKKIVRIALSNGWMKKDPFINIKFHLDDVDMAYLDEAELKALINKRFKIARMEQVKDVYLFCCFTGLAFVDVFSLKAGDIIMKDSQQWIKKQRQKTKNWCHIPLLETASKILDKYKNSPECLKAGKLLPVLSNQKMNAYLKEIADILEINKNLSTHTARHTFATTVTLANHISMEVVSKMLGHSSINMTKKYARVVDDLIQKDMQKIYGMYEAATLN
ncbi:MAG: site-specific integrase [Bacteroidales bacterium]